MQPGGNKSSAGRQLSKAERYRWIIQEPKPSSTVAVQQPKAITSTATKRGIFRHGYLSFLIG